MCNGSYEYSFPKKQKSFKNLFFDPKKAFNTTFVSCFYCLKNGHTSNSCYFKNVGVPSGKYLWLLKASSMLLTWKDPNTKWVPRCILLVFVGFMKSLMINVVLFLGCTSKDTFESFLASIMMWVK